mmetsp:Transcript_6096/g.17371  ORF Transcript_6096/g.17371 Transcript_6096/m.17371 type:complete len:403 (-) Transcript_6096:2-1210(-)
MLDAQALLQLGQAKGELLDGQRPGLVHVEHVERVLQLLVLDDDAQILHLLRHDLLLDQRLELVLVKDSVPVGVRVSEAPLQEPDEVAVALLEELALPHLHVAGGQDDLLGHHRSEQRDHRPRREGDEDDEEPRPSSVVPDQGQGDGVPIVHRRHLEEAERRRPHVREELLRVLDLVVLRVHGEEDRADVADQSHDAEDPGEVLHHVEERDDEALQHLEEGEDAHDAEEPEVHANDLGPRPSQSPNPDVRDAEEDDEHPEVVQHDLPSLRPIRFVQDDLGRHEDLHAFRVHEGAQLQGIERDEHTFDDVPYLTGVVRFDSQAGEVEHDDQADAAAGARRLDAGLRPRSAHLGGVILIILARGRGVELRVRLMPAAFRPLRHGRASAATERDSANPGRCRRGWA